MNTWRIEAICMMALALPTFWWNQSSAQGSQADETVTDDQIVVSSFAEMRYPRMAQVGNVRGIVVVRVKLDDAGKVVSTTAVSGSKLLIPDTLANAKDWQFQPNAAKSAVIIYEFEIKGRCEDKDSRRDHLFVFRKPNIASITACGEFWQP